MSSQTIGAIQPVKRPANKRDVTRIVNQFQSDTVEIDTEREPFLARATLFVFAALVIFAITWASVAHIDRIVGARGRLISTAPTVIVQPLESAIIRSINVQVGDIVKAGAVLATLDPTFAEADVQQIEAKIDSLDASIARLEAEQQGRPYAPEPGNQFEYAQLQKAIWEERQVEFTSQMRLYEERIARARENISSREREREYLAQRLKIVREVEAMRVELEQSKTGSRLNSLTAQDSRVEVERNLALTQSAIIENRHELEATVAERDVYRRQRDGKTIEDLVARRNERDGLIEQLIKARKRKEMIRLETPEDAVVLEIAQRSVGSIIKDAEAFIKLVPLNAPLEIEAQIEARDLGYIAVGDAVQVKLDAYPYQEHGMVEGTVKTISDDAFTDTRNASDTPQGAYYKARITMAPIDLRNVPDTFHLIPGMPLNAEIKIGKRSVIGYLLRPILRGMNESMREP